MLGNPYRSRFTLVTYLDLTKTAFRCTMEERYPKFSHRRIHKVPKRTFVFPFRHSQALRRIAKADEEQMSVILRQLVREEAKKRGFWRRSSKRALGGKVGTLDERVLVRVSLFHKRVARQMADADGESVSAFVRGLIREEALRRSLWLEVGRR